MNRECRSIKRNIHRWLDRELDSAQQSQLEAHVRACADCQRQAESDSRLHALLRAKQPTIQPSAGFEETFWKKVAQVREEPWIYRVYRSLEGAMIFPSLSQAFAAILIGLVLGGSGGILTTWFTQSSQGGDMHRASPDYLWGFREAGGAPAPSLAAAYLRTIKDRSAS